MVSQDYIHHSYLDVIEERVSNVSVRCVVSQDYIVRCVVSKDYIHHSYLDLMDEMVSNVSVRCVVPQDYIQ